MEQIKILNNSQLFFCHQMSPFKNITVKMFIVQNVLGKCYIKVFC